MPTNDEVAGALARLHDRYLKQVDVVLGKKRPDLARTLAARYTDDALRVILSAEVFATVTEEA